MKPDRRLWEWMPYATLARLERFDTVLLQQNHGVFYAVI